MEELKKGDEEYERRESLLIAGSQLDPERIWSVLAERQYYGQDSHFCVLASSAENRVFVSVELDSAREVEERYASNWVGLELDNFDSNDGTKKKLDWIEKLEKAEWLLQAWGRWGREAMRKVSVLIDMVEVVVMYSP